MTLEPGYWVELRWRQLGRNLAEALRQVFLEFETHRQDRLDDELLGLR